ncbi:hypothetical protein CE143_21195 [Photorhabdus luminescens]|uniref:Uncharacterized protein n=1 Tax=Photorhabdus akhurstii TaxID=171438 RepID=A0ABX8LY18_9GAMM|nr:MULTISPECIES: hypothetical protein [Photorhabdus]MCC8460009.1 hypothetical protein [Photorhabdus aegyptia]QXF35415.1 hypothetical protein B0X70_21150 [Photorhabdus akhurstii]UJD77248.1 hypothetical protein CE143_21195 [Photorhabdus luminescens]
MNVDELAKKMLVDFKLLEQNNIIPFLKKEFGVVNSAYFLGQGIDQSVDIYTYLVNGKYVIEFDVSRMDNTITKNEIISVEEYAKTIQGKGKTKKDARDNLKIVMEKANKIN